MAAGADTDIFGACTPALRLPDFHGIRHAKVVRFSASRTSRLYPQEIFLVVIFARV
jgi:hypothetical protein